MKKRSPEPSTLLGLLAHWADIKIVLTFLLWPVALDDSTKFYSPPWYVLVPGGIGSEDFGCTSWGPLPSCLAI